MSREKSCSVGTEEYFFNQDVECWQIRLLRETIGENICPVKLGLTEKKDPEGAGKKIRPERKVKREKSKSKAEPEREAKREISRKKVELERKAERETGKKEVGSEQKAEEKQIEKR